MSKFLKAIRESETKLLEHNEEASLDGDFDKYEASVLSDKKSVYNKLVPIFKKIGRAHV